MLIPWSWGRLAVCGTSLPTFCHVSPPMGPKHVAATCQEVSELTRNLNVPSGQLLHKVVGHHHARGGGMGSYQGG